jgi:hypothetical protein
VSRLVVGAAALLTAMACDVEQMRIDRVVPRQVTAGAHVDLSVVGGGFHWRCDP